LPPEDDDVVKICLLLLLAVAVAVDTVGRNAEAAYIHAGGHGTEFWVARHVAEDECFVEVHVRFCYERSELENLTPA